MNGIFLRIPGLCRTENLPKLPSFSVNPSVPRLFSSVASKRRDHGVHDHARLPSWSAAPTPAEPSLPTRPDLLGLLACSSNPFERKCLHAEQYRRSRKSTVNFASISVENRKPDPFTIVDGRYVGHDGFVVPKNFDEFHERFPQYVRNWVRRHADRSAPKEDLEDWTQDLLIHLQYLPATSKHREAGKEDIVQTFDPHKHYGANSARFFNYINLCLGNKFRSMQFSHG